MRATLTGASGLLGGNVAVLLRAQGHAVRATRRGTSKVGHLEGHGIEWVTADLGDVGALTEAFRGSDVVFHAAEVSILRKVTPALARANVEGTRHVLSAARAAKVPRVVRCSTVGAVGLSEDGRPSDEGAAWNFDARGMADGYVTTKREAEGVVAEAVRDGLDAVIVNPTYMIVDVARRRLPGRIPGMNNFVDVRDVARGALLAAERGRTGERYILGGEDLTYAEIADLIARVAGVPPVRRDLPRALVRALGWFGDAQEALGGAPLVNSVTAGYAFCKDFVFSSARAERELGYTHGPLEPAVADAIAWFRGAGMLR